MIVLDKMEADLKLMLKYADWQIAEGLSHHPTLPSAIAKSRETLREYESLKGQIAVVPVQTSEARQEALKRLNMIQAAYVCAKAVIEKKSLDETDSCDDLFEPIRAALQQPDTSEAVREWQLIETAPRDGTPLLTWSSKNDEPVIAWWDEKGGEQPPCSYYHGIWTTLNGYYVAQGHIGRKPTHWMPLPEAPPLSPQ